LALAEKILLEIELDRYVSPREIFEAKNLERVMRYINKTRMSVVNVSTWIITLIQIIFLKVLKCIVLAKTITNNLSSHSY
jgi:hypothetical protein